MVYAQPRVQVSKSNGSLINCDVISNINIKLGLNDSNKDYSIYDIV